MATTKITSPDLFDLGSLNTALQLPNGTTAERPTSPSTGEWRYNTTTNLIEFWDGADWRDLQSEDIPPTPSEHFNTVLYDGNGGTNNITGVGFQPDLVWIKQRDTAVENHNWYDSSRGIRNFIVSNSTAANVLGSVNRLNAFDSDGFTVGSDNEINDTGSKYVAWCWKANAGTTVSNGDGNITSTVQVNQAAGFSIVQYTGTGSNVQVGHGLGTAPTMVIFKNVSDAVNWYVWTTATGSLIRIEGLNTTSQAVTSGLSTTLGTSTIDFTNTGDYSASGKDYIMYCFADKPEYSKVGTYTGNGSTAGPIINTGFEPAWLMIKVISGGTDSWFIVDNKRQTSNPRDERLFANSTAVEASEAGAKIDFFSNGFQSVGTGGGSGSGQVNGNGYEYIYMAFASDASSAPTLANSFNTSLYDGSGTTRSIAGLGFSPSFVWIKNRSAVKDHMLFDSVRGVGSGLYSNLDNAQFTVTTNDFKSFDTDGFTVGQDSYTNGSGNEIVAWCWKAGGSPSINTDGTIQSIVAANQAAGFSIVRYDGNSTAGATVGHGLSAAPETIIIKCMNTGSTNWINYYESLGNSDYLTLNLTNDVDTSTDWFFSNATTFTLNNTFGNANTSSRQYIAYCFDSVAGFSKVGSYTGNGGTQSITGLGFQPSFLLFKKTDANQDWLMVDSARGGQKELIPNSTAAEYTMTNGVSSFDSDGWTMGANNSLNTNAANYVYVAFKENPAQPAVASGEMEYLVVAGGASGGSNGGGGGAGGLRTSYGNTSGGGASAETAITLAAGTYTITVGAGGASIDNATNYQDPGNAGSASTISGGATVNTVGGGGGGSNNIAPSTGGSGGGSGSGTGGPTAAAGTANEGFAGGDGMAATHPYLGGGGGGAGSVGVAVDGSGPYPGGGGAGLMVAIDATSTAYAGGGGGTGGTGSGYTGGGGASGSGGGGQGGPYNGSGTAGSTNTGGGGGATGDAGSYTSGAGGSGIAILRMNTSDYSGATTGSPTVTTSGSETILTYTGSGTYVHS